MVGRMNQNYYINHPNLKITRNWISCNVFKQTIKTNFEQSLRVPSKWMQKRVFLFQHCFIEESSKIPDKAVDSLAWSPWAWSNWFRKTECPQNVCKTIVLSYLNIAFLEEVSILLEKGVDSCLLGLTSLFLETSFLSGQAQLLEYFLLHQRGLRKNINPQDRFLIY